MVFHYSFSCLLINPIMDQALWVYLQNLLTSDFLTSITNPSSPLTCSAVAFNLLFMLYVSSLSINIRHNSQINILRQTMHHFHIKIFSIAPCFQGSYFKSSSSDWYSRPSMIWPKLGFTALYPHYFCKCTLYLPQFKLLNFLNNSLISYLMPLWSLEQLFFSSNFSWLYQYLPLP